MILQVIFDDFFGDHAIEQFDSYRDRMRFVLVKTNGSEIKIIKKIQPQDIIVYGSQEYANLLAHLSDYKAVIMHGLFSFIQYDIVRHMPENVKLAWVLWGGEIYAWKDSSLFRLAPITRMVCRLKQIKDNIFGVKDFSTKVPYDILRRVDYMLGSSYEIYEEAKAYIGNIKMKHLMYSYFTLERLIGEDLLDKTVNGNNILLGNSAAVENNHIDILMHLKRIGIPKDRKMIVPLSYDAPWIKNTICKVGKIVFPGQFFPLLELMPRKEYNKLVQSCSVFIANHHNPNAFGNVLTALWLGERVYVSKYNVQTRFLQRLGLHVNIIETDLRRGNPNLYCALSEREREGNRAIIREYYGKNIMQKNLVNIVTTLDS